MVAELRVLRTKTRPIGRKPGPSRDEPATVHPLPHIAEGLINHALIEAVMAGMGREDRARFWRDHIAVLGQALAERGAAEEVVAAILADHFRQVRARHRARASLDRRRAAYPIAFDGPPAIGTEIDLRGKRAVVVGVEQIVRKSDGHPSWLIHWDIDGRRATSGLRCSGVYWLRQQARDDE